jgi:hypothetical protein
MPNTIRTKRSSTASAVPSGLQAGELAVNTTDKTLFVGDGTNTHELTRRAASSNSGASTRIQLSSSTGALTDSSTLTFDASAGTLTAASLEITSDTTVTTIARTGNSTRKLYLRQASGGEVVIGDGPQTGDGVRFVVDEIGGIIQAQGTILSSLAGMRCSNGSLFGLQIADNDGSHHVELRVPTTVTSNVTLTLPATAGSNGQVLTTNGTGTLSWTTPSGGGGSVPDFLLFNAGII